MDKDYGSKIDYDPLWEGPMTHRRRSTNFAWLIVFVIFMLVWGGVSFYAIKNGNWTEFKLDNSTDTKETVGLAFQSSNENISKVAPKLFIKMMLSTIILSGIFIILLRYFAKFVVYTMLFAFLVFMVIGIVMLFKNTGTTAGKEGVPMWLPIVCSVFLVIMIIYAIFVRRTINLACGVIRESGKAVIDLPSTLMFPLLSLFVWSGILALFYINFASLATFPKEMQDKKGGMIGMCHALNIVAALWSYLFVDGMNQLILAGTFSTWFWTHNKNNVPSLMVIRFAGTAVRYHLGTVAMGSFIITVCKIITSIVKSIQRKAREEGGAAAIAATCLACIVELIEQFIEYITENAYIMCATHGTDFCTSAKNAFNLIMRNVVRCYVVTQITSIVIGVTIVVVMIISISLTMYTTQESMKAAGDSVAWFLIIFAIIACAVANYIFTVLNMAIRTLFISALEDFERHDGSQERPYYMSYKLRKLFLKDSSPTSAV